ncbi:ATP-dependent DNA helicase RecQ [Spirochaetia bacterium]|nr:ATP-dependent DNA helicase RecQ [Spirochaetia bacterium]
MDQDKLSILKSCFGYTSFRPGQEAVIDALLAGRDALAVMPTGAGKSLCYQIPALLLEGITVIISPLISLMKDQVNALEDAEIPAAYLNSSLSPDEYSDTIFRAVQGDIKILYIAPERLQRGLPPQLVEAQEIAMVVIDEAHCISQWGHDFRPSYLYITDFIRQLPKRPITAAFTATATGKVREDIMSILDLEEPYTIITGFNRENLYFEVQRPKDKFQALMEILRSRKNKSGIIYCSTRKSVEEISRTLSDRGFAATRYHAGLDDGERHRNQDDFIYDRKTIMVATNAFGMGIDKSNVSFVIHYNMPKNIESYYQEAGRAGRDGEAADCILLYSPQDVRINQFLIHNGQDDEAEKDEARIEHNLELLKAMTFYATSPDCLRSRLLGYFGETAPHYCGNCSNCNTVFEDIDITIPAQKIISCVYRIEQQGRRFGKAMIVNILRGSKLEKIKTLALDKLSTYGIMADMDAHRIRTMLDYLVEQKYLAVSADEYPVVYLVPKSKEIIVEKQPLSMKLPKEQKRKTEQPLREEETYTGTAGTGFGSDESGRTSGAGLGRRSQSARSDYGPSSALEPGDEGLFTRLKELRTRLAQEAHVPPYIIFSDASLRDMCRKRPVNREQFLQVSGVGSVKLDKYGEVFISLIADT